MHRYARAGRFGFDRQEGSVVDVLRVKAHKLEELFATGVLPDSRLKRVVFVLAITRHLDVGVESQLPVGVRAPSKISGEPPRPTKPPAAPVVGAVPAAKQSGMSPSAPRTPTELDPPAEGDASPKDSPEVAVFKEEIRGRAESIGSLTYYEILGVERRAPAATISAAFFDLAKRWHPDRLGPQYADVREMAARVFSRMTEAHQVLSNDEQRQEYERLMKEGGATDEEQKKVQRILRAATAFQKAEVLARRGNYAEAEKEAQKAYEGDPEQAEYMALYAEILSVKPGRANFDDVVQMVNKARHLQPGNIRVHVYRARVLNRAGDRNGALREFQWIAERDPNNVEAAREVRLYKMRAGDRRDSKSPGPNVSSKGGLLNQDIGQLFGKFFKR
jgi:curved DNA-binding protein CbpA